MTRPRPLSPMGTLARRNAELQALCLALLDFEWAVRRAVRPKPAEPRAQAGLAGVRAALNDLDARRVFQADDPAERNASILHSVRPSRRKP